MAPVILGHAQRMPAEAEVAEHRAVQATARVVLAQLAAEITADDTEQSIAAKAYRGLCERGCPDTWYYDCPAYVLLGSRSCMSMSGRDYRPAAERVGATNLVTVDLSPMRAGRWGDCARSFFVEQGQVTSEPSVSELALGKAFIESLHRELPRFVQRETTFHELFEWANARIAAAGFVNLDFARNVGHSLAQRREDRVYLKAGNHAKLASVSFFTFEPHVRAEGGMWGFKHENVFFFGATGSLEEL
jgi:Xaa-Pro aminopeptidase